jgi:hypothetical protein
VCHARCQASEIRPAMPWQAHELSQVIVEAVLDLHSCATSLVREWDKMGVYDNLSLVCIDVARVTGGIAPSAMGVGMAGRQGGGQSHPRQGGLQLDWFSSCVVH